MEMKSRSVKVRTKKATQAIVTSVEIDARLLLIPMTMLIEILDLQLMLLLLHPPAPRSLLQAASN
jgi:hypothetical protein